MEDKVVIVSHVFPPSPGVGGRRWAKYAKYLKRNNWDVKILTHKQIRFSQDSLWLDDIKNLDVPFFYLGWYPRILNQIKVETFLQKIQYGFWVRILPFLTKGNYYDRACFFKSSFLKKLKEVLNKEQTNKLIVSGAPFNLLYYAALYCKENKDVSLFADFRDPWTWGQNYGIKTISKKRQVIEKAKEEFVVKVAKKVFIPTDSMLQHLQKVYPQYYSKLFLLPHGFDKEGLEKKINFEVKEKVRLAFLGELYGGLSSYFDAIAKGISNNPYTLDIFSSNNRYREIFEAYNLLQSRVHYNNLLPPNELFTNLKEVDYVLIVHPEFAKDYISTKFHELIYAQIPIIYVGEEGKTSEFIVENNLGIYLGSDKEEIANRLTNIQTFKKYNYKPTFDITPFSLEALTEQLIKQLDEKS